MSELSVLLKAFAVVLILVVSYACERDDAEPEFVTQKFSRLYVSLEEYNDTESAAFVNVRVIYPADSTEFELGLSHTSSAKGGGPLYFSPYLKSLFQASANRDGRNDTVVYRLEVGNTNGVLSNAGQLRHRLYSYVKGMTYHPMTESFFIANSEGEDAGFYVVNRPRSKNGHAKPLKKFKVPGMTSWGLAIGSEETLFASKTGADGGIYVFERMVTKEVNRADSTATIEPDRILKIAGTSNLRGLSYDTVKNVMAVVDYPTTGAVGQGRVLIFDNFSSLTKQESITPTRIITGVATGLHQPVDVALDTREGGKYLYVADRAAKKVLRFNIADKGNVAPDKVIDTKGQSPVGLALDSRDESTLNR